MHNTLPENKKSSGSRLGKALIGDAKTDAAKEQAVRSCWPKNWPADIEAIRNQKKVDGDISDKIIRTVKDRMVGAKLNTHADFDIAARIIMEEFKCFQSIAHCDHEPTLLSDTEPDTDEAPYVIGMGDGTEENLSFSFHVDKVPMYSGQAMDALVFMYCYYWIFDLSSQPRSKPVFMFVEYMLFQERTVSPTTTKATITNLLSDLQIV
ncbi:hypothetical protein QAD02_021919 [Eretmocerus hayati]|uniref:Uncharacterized protein n=1 Tax=Eretmocerus hayati TaxID=131215 RepID=A0ACC2PR90_9HYME|nr:hypothetical protein QAD02_021919 [Eretmocerus hayati]